MKAQLQFLTVPRSWPHFIQVIVYYGFCRLQGSILWAPGWAGYPLILAHNLMLVWKKRIEREICMGGRSDTNNAHFLIK